MWVRVRYNPLQPLSIYMCCDSKTEIRLRVYIVRNSTPSRVKTFKFIPAICDYFKGAELSKSNSKMVLADRRLFLLRWLYWC